MNHLPEHWDRSRLKWDASLVAGATPDSDDTGYWLDGADPDGTPFVTIGDMSRRDRVSGTARSLSRDGVTSRNMPIGQPGTLLLAMYASVGEVAFLDIEATWNQALLGITTDRDALDPRYLRYVLLDMRDDLLREVRSNTQSNLNAGQVGDIWYARPPLAEQRAIADYLDHETTKIDTLITKQEALIETLRERRSGVIEESLGHAVGSGRRLKWGIAESDVRVGAGWEELPLLSVSITWGVRRRDEISNDEAKADDLSGYKIARQGALVVNRMRAFQGALGISPVDGIVSPDYAVLDVGRDLDAHWLAATMRTRRFVSEMTSRLKGIGGTEGGAVRTPRINVADLLDIRIDLPRLEDQRSDIEALQTRMAEIDALVSKAEQFIALAKERRAALITSAVAGRIEPRGAA